MRDVLGDLLGVFAPKAAYERAAWRQAHAALRDLSGRSERAYAAAKRDRLTNDWFARGSSADAELALDLATLRNRSRQMVRDNTYASAALRNLTSALVGDGITARAVHGDDTIASKAQQLWDDWAGGLVDGERDFYGIQKLAVRGMIEGGDVIQLWQTVDGEPDARLRLLEGDFVDTIRNRLLEDGGRVIAGVEFGPDGQRRAYWIYPNHPGDVLGPVGVISFLAERVDARDVDHLYECLRAGQTRGAPWFHAGMRKLRDVDETEEATRIKKRVEACLAVLRKPAEGLGGVSPLGEQATQTDTSNWETLRPGMIVTLKPGEDATVVNPSSSGDGDGFQRSQKMAAAAALGIPYHVITGDVTNANYSSLRADIVGYHQRLDDWTFNDIVPRQCDPAFRRVMRREALKRRMPQLMQVKAAWTPPPRPWVDPLKDMQAELAEMRAIPGEFARSCARRGLDWRKEIVLQRQINEALDANRIALDSDPRRLNGLGALQKPVAYLASGQTTDEPAGPSSTANAA